MSGRAETPRRRALRMTPGNAFLLVCALGPWVFGAVCIAWDHRDELLDAIADSLPIQHG